MSEPRTARGSTASTGAAGADPGADRGPYRRIGGLALPIMFAALIGMLVQFAVVALLGRISDQALYMRSLYLPVAFLFVALAEAIDVCAQVSVAIARGRGDLRAPAALAGTLIRLGLAVVGVTALIVVVGAPLLAGLVRVSSADRDLFVSFLRWSALANIAAVAPTVLVAAIRGWGRAAAAAAVSVIMAVVQVGGVAVLGYGTGLGVYSVPYATLASAAAGLGLGVLAWRRSGLPAEAWRRWRAEAARVFGTVGGPVAASYLVLFGANLGTLWVIGPFGPAVVSGYASAYTLQTVVLVPAIALGSAAAIVMNHLRGNGRSDRIPAAFRAAVAMSVAIYLPASAVLWWARDGLAGTATGSPQIAAHTSRYLLFVAPTIGLICLVLVATTVLEQLGRGFVALALNVGYFGFVIALGGALARRAHDPDPLYLTITLTNLVGAPVVLSTAYALLRRLSSPAPLSGPSTASTA
ncbi:MAG: hypothetical protein V7603_3986 [Micromonosporaceae bacterium]